MWYLGAPFYLFLWDCLGILNLWISVCDRQPPRWLPVAPASSYSCPYLVLYHIYQVGLCWPIEYGRSDGMLLLRLCLSPSLHIILSRSWIIFSGEVSYHIVSSPTDRSMWWRIEAFHQQPCWWSWKQSLHPNQAFRCLQLQQTPWL